MDLLLLTRSIYPLHGYGGMERHCFDWIHAMRKRQCRIHVVTMTPVHAEGLADFDHDVFFYLLPGKSARRIVPRITSYPRWVRNANTFLRTLAAQTSVKAVYAHGLAAAGCEGLSVPVIYNPHGMEEFKTHGLKYLAYAPFRSMSRRGAALASRVIATDQTLVPEIRKYLSVPQERIVVIPNAVRLDEDEPRGALVPVQGDPLFLAAGRHEQNKGFHILLEALARAKQLPPGWKLALAGTGSQSERLKQLASKKGLRGQVSFVGNITDAELNTLFERADLFVNPTLFEGSSIVTLEAMRAGLPVLASGAGGIPDKVIAGRNGWTVPPGDVDALARALDQACAQRAQWKDMGGESASIVRDKYSWDAAADQFLALLQ